MYVIRRKDLIRNVAENWRLAHQRRAEWMVAPGAPHPEEIHRKLVALPPNAGPKEIAEITGDKRWTANLCQECGEDREILVVFGAHEVSHPTDAAFLCLGCLEAGVQLARARAQSKNTTKSA